MALPWLLTRLTNGVVPANGTVIAPPPWGLLGLTNGDETAARGGGIILRRGGRRRRRKTIEEILEEAREAIDAAELFEKELKEDEPELPEVQKAILAYADPDLWVGLLSPVRQLKSSVKQLEARTDPAADLEDRVMRLTEIIMRMIEEEEDEVLLLLS